MKPLFSLCPPFSFPCKISFVDLAADFQASLCARLWARWWRKWTQSFIQGAHCSARHHSQTSLPSFGIVGRAADLAWSGQRHSPALLSILPWTSMWSWRNCLFSLGTIWQQHLPAYVTRWIRGIWHELDFYSVTYKCKVLFISSPAEAWWGSQEKKNVYFGSVLMTVITAPFQK